MSLPVTESQYRALDASCATPVGPATQHAKSGKGKQQKRQRRAVSEEDDSDESDDDTAAPAAKANNRRGNASKGAPKKQLAGAAPEVDGEVMIIEEQSRRGTRATKVPDVAPAAKDKKQGGRRAAQRNTVPESVAAPQAPAASPGKAELKVMVQQLQQQLQQQQQQQQLQHLPASGSQARLGGAVLQSTAPLRNAFQLVGRPGESGGTSFVFNPVITYGAPTFTLPLMLGGGQFTLGPSEPPQYYPSSGQQPQPGWQQ